MSFDKVWAWLTQWLPNSVPRDGSPFFFGTGTWVQALNSMDRQMLMEHLSQAERHVAEGMVHVEKQRTLVENMARDGHDIREHEALLRQFEETLGLHIKNRDQLQSLFLQNARQSVAGGRRYWRFGGP